METLPTSSSDADVLRTVREWIELLIEERYTDAYAFLYHRPDDPFSPEVLEAFIQNCGNLAPDLARKEVLKVTAPEVAVDPIGSHSYELWRDDRTGTLDGMWFSLPLNGRWSDLSGVFDFPVVDEEVVFELVNFGIL